MPGHRLLLAVVVVLLLGAFPNPARAQLTEADIHVAEGVLELDRQRYDQALEAFRRALQITPDHVEALYYSGVAYMAQRRLDQAVQALERARTLSPRDTAILYQLGLAYVAREQYDRAQPLLEEAFRASPDLDGLGYYVGFLRYRSKDYRGALNAFRVGRASDPEIQQLTRFYTGLALGVLGLTSQALAEVEQSLRLAPGSAVTGPAERLRESMAAARTARDRLVSAELRLGGFFDDNVAVVPDRNSREPLVPLLRERDDDSFGALVGARINYSWLRHLLGPRDDWDSTVGYSFYASVYGDLPEFDVRNHLLNLGVTHTTAIANRPFQTGAAYAWDILHLGGDEFLQRHTAILSGTMVFDERHLTQIVGRYQSKDFSGPLIARAENRDAANYMIGGVHLIRFAQDAHFIRLGYQFDYDDTTGRNYRYRGHRLLAGAQYTLPWNGIRLKYDLDVHLRDYTKRNTLFPSFDPGSRRRKDEELTHIVRMEIPLRWLAVPGSQWITDRSFTLSLEYLRVDAHSNLAIFDFTRNVGTVSISWVY